MADRARSRSRVHGSTQDERQKYGVHCNASVWSPANVFKMSDVPIVTPSGRWVCFLIAELDVTVPLAAEEECMYFGKEVYSS